MGGDAPSRRRVWAGRVARGLFGPGGAQMLGGAAAAYGVYLLFGLGIALIVGGAGLAAVGMLREAKVI